MLLVLLSLAGLMAYGANAETVPAMPTPLKLEWDVSKANNTVSQEFFVSEADTYHVMIGFMCSIESQSQLYEMYQFTGDGRTGPYDLVHHNWATWEEYHQADPFDQKNSYTIKFGHPGTVIPVHIRIKRIEVPGNPTLVLDQTLNTKGLSRVYLDGIHRDVALIDLEPGKYRITASTLQQTVLPGFVTETILEVFGSSSVGSTTNHEGGHP
jgi:hypothetical protein